MRNGKRLMTACLAVIAALTLTTEAQAEDRDKGRPSSNHGRADGKSEKQVEQELAWLLAHGADAKKIQAKLGLIKVSDPVGAPEVTPMSTNSVVSVNRPSVYYDTGAKSYYADAGWSFTTWPVDDPAGFGRQAIGGWDGFGVRFSQQVSSSGGSLVYCPKSTVSSVVPFSCTSATNYWENSADGTSWRFQDEVYTSFSPTTAKWNVGTGTMVKAFKRISGGCLQIGTTYAHTWGGSSITGFGVQPWGFSISWSDADQTWQRASALGSLGC
jgi:hypothetical protein